MDNTYENMTEGFPTGLRIRTHHLEVHQGKTGAYLRIQCFSPYWRGREEVGDLSVCGDIGSGLLNG